MKNNSTRRVIISGIVVATLGLTMQSAGALAAIVEKNQSPSMSMEILSLPKEFTLSGSRLLLIGNTDFPQQDMKVELWNGNSSKPALTRHFFSDAEKAFVYVLDLKQLCVTEPSEASSGEYTLTLNDTPHHLFRMECPNQQSVYPFEQMQFAQIRLGGDTHPEEIYVESPDKAVFAALGQPWMHAYTAYASVVMSRDLYVGNQGRINVAPWKYLEPGQHHFYIAPYDPIRKIVYEPLVVPFTVQGGIGEQLKATVYYAPGAASILMLVFFGSVLYIRRIKYLRRGICLIGDNYQDDFPEHFVG